MGKKDKSCVYTQEELDGLNTLLLCLKSEARTIQYSMETAGLTKYRNDHVPGLRGAPNTDDHSAYLSKVKKESWSYPAKGNLSTVRQFIKEWEGCPDADKRCQVDKTLQDKGMPGIPQENIPKGGKRELIKACYVMKVLWSMEGEIIDAKHPDYGWDQKYQAVRNSEPGVDEKSREQWSDDGLGKINKRQHGLRILSPMSVYLSKPPDLEQSCPATFPRDHGMRNAKLLVCVPQHREHVETRHQPWAPHCKAHHCEPPKEVVRVHTRTSLLPTCLHWFL